MTMFEPIMYRTNYCYSVLFQSKKKMKQNEYMTKREIDSTNTISLDYSVSRARHKRYSGKNKNALCVPCVERETFRSRFKHIR